MNIAKYSQKRQENSNSNKKKKNYTISNKSQFLESAIGNKRIPNKGIQISNKRIQRVLDRGVGEGEGTVMH